MLRRADHDLAAEAMRALDRIREIFPTGVVPPEVLTRVMGLPPMLRVSGVLPVLAFYAAKGKGNRKVDQAYGIVGSQLRAQIIGVLGWAEQGTPSLDLDFLKRLTEHLRRDPATTARITVRLEEFSAWLRRLAEALEKEQDLAKAARKADAGGEYDGNADV
ncbi:type III-B CRISPR module-associated protein Cmr5 [Microbispora bryophytorum]|uniref:type III-B CRISPR module-associated protein Cmr5 n=1 Tax=Microbispora bryophytorum TaxID=1460882 RepID=UPI0034054838